MTHDLVIRTGTAVMGNCGVGFAPCRGDDHDMLVDVMAGSRTSPAS